MAGSQILEVNWLGREPSDSYSRGSLLIVPSGLFSGPRFLVFHQETPSSRGGFPTPAVGPITRRSPRQYSHQPRSFSDRQLSESASDTTPFFLTRRPSRRKIFPTPHSSVGVGPTVGKTIPDIKDPTVGMAQLSDMIPRRLVMSVGISNPT